MSLLNNPGVAAHQAKKKTAGPVSVQNTLNETVTLDRGVFVQRVFIENASVETGFKLAFGFWLFSIIIFVVLGILGFCGSIFLAALL